MITVYGIKNCDTVKKALKWLAEHGIEHQLHDYRTDGLNEDFLIKAEQQFGWDNLLNRRSTTWRNLALSVLTTYPTLIKRPITIQDDIALIGFNDKLYEQAFS